MPATVAWALMCPEELWSEQTLRWATTLCPCWQQSQSPSWKMRLSTSMVMKPAHRVLVGTWPGKLSSIWITWAAHWAAGHPVWTWRTRQAPSSSTRPQSLVHVELACPTAPPSGLQECHAHAPSNLHHPHKLPQASVCGRRLPVAAQAPPPAPALDPAHTGRGQTGWAWHHLHPPPPLSLWTLCSHQHLTYSRPVCSLLGRVWQRRRAAGILVLPRTPHRPRYGVLKLSLPYCCVLMQIPAFIHHFKFK